MFIRVCLDKSVLPFVIFGLVFFVIYFEILWVYKVK